MIIPVLSICRARDISSSLQNFTRFWCLLIFFTNYKMWQFFARFWYISPNFLLGSQKSRRISPNSVVERCKEIHEFWRKLAEMPHKICKFSADVYWEFARDFIRKFINRSFWGSSETWLPPSRAAMNRSVRDPRVPPSPKSRYESTWLSSMWGIQTL